MMAAVRHRVDPHAVVALSLMFLFGGSLAFAGSTETDSAAVVRAVMATDVGVGLALVAIVRYFSTRRLNANRATAIMLADSP